MFADLTGPISKPLPLRSYQIHTSSRRVGSVVPFSHKGRRDQPALRCVNPVALGEERRRPARPPKVDCDWALWHGAAS